MQVPMVRSDRSSPASRRRLRRTAALACAVFASAACAAPALASGGHSGLVFITVNGDHRYVHDIDTHIPWANYVGCSTPTLTFYRADGSYWFTSVGPQRCGATHDWDQYRNQIFPNQTKVCASWSGVWGTPCLRIFE